MIRYLSIYKQAAIMECQQSDGLARIYVLDVSILIYIQTMIIGVTIYNR